MSKITVKDHERICTIINKVIYKYYTSSLERHSYEEIFGEAFYMYWERFKSADTSKIKDNYFYMWFRYGILEYLTQRTNRKRILHEAVRDYEVPDNSSIYLRRQIICNKILQEVQKSGIIDSRQQKVLVNSYKELDKKTLRELSEQLGVSIERVRQIGVQATKRLDKWSEENDLKKLQNTE
jgi:RNA polymerase sigma factor (sigma-70 family)